MGAQPRLHMAERDFAVEAGQGGRHDRGGVSLGEHQVGSMPLQAGVQSLHQSGGQGVEGLVRLHEVEVRIRLDVEQAQSLVQHLPVLGRGQHYDFPVAGAAQGQHQGCHLDGLRPGADHA